MAFANEQPPARNEEIGDHLRPPIDVRKPAQGTDTGVYEIEPALAEDVGGRVAVGLDDFDGEPKIKG